MKSPQSRTPPARDHGLVGGGLVVVLGEGHCFSAWRYHCFRYGPCSVVTWEGSFNSYLRKLSPSAIVGHYRNQRAAVDPCPVRVTRRSDTFTAVVSGVKWGTLHTAIVEVPRVLRVGVFVRHDLNEEAEVAFVGYTVTKPD